MAAKVRDLASAQNLTSQASTVVSLSGIGTTAEVYRYLMARVAVDNSGSAGAAPGLTVTDSKSNTWTVLGPANQDPGAASAGITGYIAYTKISAALTTSDSITFTWGSGNPAAKAIQIEEWVGIDSVTPVAVAALAATGVSTSPSVARTPLAASQVFYGALAIEGIAGDTYTQDADTTDGSWVGLTSVATADATATNNALIRGAYKIVTGTSAQTWNPTITNRDWAQLGVVFGEGPVLVAGSQASTTATANAGAPVVRPAGSQATETDTANVGTPTSAVSISDPSDITDLGLWLHDAGLTGGEGASVTTWADSSGNGRDATFAGTTAPVRNLNQRGTLSAVRFAGSASAGGLNLPNFLTGFAAGEIFIVVKVDNDPGVVPETGLWAFGSDTADVHYPYSDGTIYDSFGSTARKTTVNPTPSLSSAYRVYNVTSKAGEWTSRIDGTQVYTTATNTVGWTTAPVIGRMAGSALYTKGWIAEVVLFSRELTTTERAAMLAYFAGQDTSSVAGAKATETDTAQAGAPSARPAGSQATGTNTANTGTPLVRSPGSQATESDTALAGSARRSVAGSQATTTSSAFAGSPNVRPAGAQATETETANAGALTIRKTGALGAEADTPNTGAPLIRKTGAQASEADTAQVGAPSIRQTGSQAAETDTAQAGARALRIGGAQAAESDTALAGSAIGGATGAGSQAAETDAAQTGTPASRSAGSLASTTSIANAGVPFIRSAGAQATETETAQAGARLIRIAGSQATSTASTLAGSVLVRIPGSQATETDTAAGQVPGVLVAGSQAVVTTTPFPGSPLVRSGGSQATTTHSSLPGAVLFRASGSQVAESDSASPGAPWVVTTNVVWPPGQFESITAASHFDGVTFAGNVDGTGSASTADGTSTASNTHEGTSGMASPSLEGVTG